MSRSTSRVGVLGVSCLLLSMFAAAPARADSWWGVDKGEHLALSFGMATGWSTALWLLGDDPPLVRAALSTSLSLIPGLMKELYDSGRHGNSFSSKDLTWDLIGAVTGTLSVLGIEYLIKWLRPPTLVQQRARVR